MNPKEFEELPVSTSYIVSTFDTKNNSLLKQYELIDKAKKDAWNAAIKWAAENVKLDYSTLNVYKVKKESILKGLID